MMSLMIYALSCFIASAHAIPLLVLHKERDVVAPPIISPAAGTIWHVGETQTVTWNTSSIPSSVNITNSVGQIVLGYSTWHNENLMFDSPLASNFPIEAGKVSFVVPDVPTRDNYIVCLFGDSGDISGNFTIIGSSASSASSATAATSSTAAASSGVLAASSSTASSSATSSVSVVLTTEVVTSMSVTTVPGSSTVAASSPVSSPDGPSAATTLTASNPPSTESPSAGDPPSSPSVSGENPASSSSASSSSSGTTSGNAATGAAFSWKASNGFVYSSTLGVVFALAALLL